MAPTEKQLAALAKHKNTFKKGQVNNPKGRPVGCLNFKTVMKKILSDSDILNGGTGEPMAPVAKRVFIALSRLNGNDRDALAACSLILDRLEGKTPQTVRQENENPLSSLSDEDLQEMLSKKRE